MDGDPFTGNLRGSIRQSLVFFYPRNIWVHAIRPFLSQPIRGHGAWCCDHKISQRSWQLWWALVALSTAVNLIQLGGKATGPKSQLQSTLVSVSNIPGPWIYQWMAHENVHFLLHMLFWHVEYRFWEFGLIYTGGHLHRCEPTNKMFGIHTFQNCAGTIWLDSGTKMSSKTHWDNRGLP